MYTLVVGFILSKTERRVHCRLVHNTKYRDCRKSNEWAGESWYRREQKRTWPYAPKWVIVPGATHPQNEPGLGETQTHGGEKVIQAVSTH